MLPLIKDVCAHTYVHTRAALASDPVSLALTHMIISCDRVFESSFKWQHKQKDDQARGRTRV